MRNIILTHKSLAAATVLLLAGCTSKSCRCYLLDRWGAVPITETYIDEGTPCAELGYDHPNPDDSSFRLCTEWDDPMIDTMDVVRMFWGE